MPSKKTKTKEPAKKKEEEKPNEAEVKQDEQHTEETKKPENEQKPAESGPVIVPGAVVVEPPADAGQPAAWQNATAEEGTGQTEEKPEQEKAGPMVKEGELASAIADLANVVDNSGKNPSVQPEGEQNKVFEPVSADTGEEDKKEDGGGTPAAGINPGGEEQVMQKSKDKPKGSVLWVIIAFLAGLVLGVLLGYLLWGQNSLPFGISGTNTQTGKPVITQPVGEIKPTAEPKPAPDRAALKVQVLNGNGGRGVAAEGRDWLEGKGYKDVAIGNAEGEDFPMTEIALKQDKMDYFGILKEDLSGKYQVATEASTLTAGSEYDAVVTIGLK